MYFAKFLKSERVARLRNNKKNKKKGQVFTAEFDYIYFCS